MQLLARSPSPFADSGTQPAELKEDSGSAKVDDDDIASVSTEDPVTLAMHATLNQSDDDFEDEVEAEEQILYPQIPWSG